MRWGRDFHSAELREEKNDDSLLPRIVVLAIGDDGAAIRQQGMLAHGFASFFAPAVAEARTLVADQKPDLLLIAENSMRDQLRGVIEQIRAVSRTQFLPVVIWGDEPGLSARTELDKCGINDVVSSCCASDTGAAVLRAVFRRTRPVGLKSRLEISELAINELEYRAEWAGTKIQLSPSEYRLLTALVDEPCHMLTRLELVRRVWGPNEKQTSRHLDQVVKNLRVNLRAVHADHLIETVHRIGYRLNTKKTS